MIKKSMLKVEKFKMTGWITLEDLKRCVVLTKKPKVKCVEVNIEIVPIKKEDVKC